MGACDFDMCVGGRSIADAFKNAVDDALYWHGHAGYSGTIAEKDGYKEFVIPAGMTSEEFLDLIQRVESQTVHVVYGGDDDYARRAKAEAKDHWDKLVKLMGEYEAHQIENAYNDKWGPAVCWADPVVEGQYFFCGIASS